MKSMIPKLKTILSSALLCITISMATIPSANAQFFIGFAFGFLCGGINTAPILIPTKDGPRLVVVSMTTTVLKVQVEGKNRIRHFAIIKLVNPDDGTVIWTRSLALQSLAVATVFSTDPLNFFINEGLNIPDRPASPVAAFPGQCLGVTVVESGGIEQLAFTMGTTAQWGGSIPMAQAQNPGTQAVGSSGTEAPVTGKDKTVINVWMLNIDSGAVARIFKPRAKPNWYFLPFNSGVFDLDNDGHHELVFVRARYIGEDRYDYMYESFDPNTGALKNSIITNQNNKQLMQP